MSRNPTLDAPFAKVSVVFNFQQSINAVNGLKVRGKSPSLAVFIGRHRQQHFSDFPRSTGWRFAQNGHRDVWICSCRTHAGRLGVVNGGNDAEATAFVLRQRLKPAGLNESHVGSIVEHLLGNRFNAGSIGKRHGTEELFRVISVSGNLSQADAITHEGARVAGRKPFSAHVFERFNGSVFPFRDEGNGRCVVGIRTFARDHCCHVACPERNHSPIKARTGNECINVLGFDCVFKGTARVLANLYLVRKEDFSQLLHGSGNKSFFFVRIG